MKLLICFLLFSGYSLCQNDHSRDTFLIQGDFTYLHIIDSTHLDKVSLHYSFGEGYNRPSVEVTFIDGPNLFFNAVCEGDYSWCIRNYENEDIGYMKLTFQDNGKRAIVSIKHNELSDNYLKYLHHLKGNYERIAD